MIELEVTTHDGHDYKVEVEEYDPVTLNDKINDESINTLQIGELIISRLNIKTIIPVQDEEQTEKNE